LISAATPGYFRSMKVHLRDHPQIVWPPVWYPANSLSEGRVAHELGEAGVFKSEFLLEHSPPRLVATIEHDGREWNVALVSRNDDIHLLRRVLGQLGQIAGARMVLVGSRDVDI